MAAVGLAKAFLGTVAARVMAAAPCPVLTVCGRYARRCPNWGDDTPGEDIPPVAEFSGQPLDLLAIFRLPPWHSGCADGRDVWPLWRPELGRS